MKKDIQIDIYEDTYTVEECLQILKEKLNSKKNFYFSTLFSTSSSKIEIVTYFLAILEMVKSNKIKVLQNKESIKIESVI